VVVVQHKRSKRILNTMVLEGMLIPISKVEVSTELLGAEVLGRAGRRAQGKQGSQKKDWGRSGDLEVHIYMCVFICVCMCA
jgi:hypothetical protein